MNKIAQSPAEAFIDGSSACVGCSIYAAPTLDLRALGIDPDDVRIEETYRGLALHPRIEGGQARIPLRLKAFQTVIIKLSER